MKKIRKITAIVSILSLCFALSAPVMADEDISVYLNNEKLQFDVEPKLVNNRTMVPMRAILEKLGAEVTWDGSTNTVHAYKHAKNQGISITIGEPRMVDIFSREIPLDVPAMLENGRTLLPLRVISEVFGCDVQWDGNTSTVTMYSDDFIDFGKSTGMQEEIQVATAEELLNSIGDNRKLILTADSYNLSNLHNVDNEYVEKQLYWDDTYFDAYTVKNVVNMTIEGNATIVIDEINADVLQFQNCGDITLSGLTVGHTVGNEYYQCEGAVIDFYNCRNIDIDTCNLFGCGAFGVFAHATENIQINNCRIYDCTYTGIWLSDASSATVTETEFCDSVHTNGFLRIDESAITLQNCDVHDIVCDASIGTGVFVETWVSPATINIENCTFTNNTFSEIATSDAENITFTDCTFHNNAGNMEHPWVVYNNSSLQ